MHSNSDNDCGGCTVGRRAFLRDTAIAAAALAGISSRGFAMPVNWVSPLAASAKEASYAVPAKDGVSIDKDKEVILARHGKNVFAFGLECPHQNTELKWLARDNRFQCPKHKSKYTADGVYIEGRATRSMDRYAVRLDGKNIVVNLDKLYEEDQDGPLWSAAFVSV